MTIPLAEQFGKAFLPKRVRPNLRKYLLKAGIIKEPYEFFGAMFYLSYLITLAIYFIFFYGTIGAQPSMLFVFLYALAIWIILPLFLLGLISIAIYFYLDLRIFNRTRKMEVVLPDFLQLVSSNLKGGMSFEKALWGAIKPRFGILANEVAIAAKKVMTGHDVDEALTEFADKYDSPMLKRSMGLIIGEIQSGGKVADIIDKVISNLKKTKELKDEMVASVITYMIFIGAVVIFISPLLFALSFNLLKVIQNVTGMLAGATGQGAPGLLSGMGEVSINEKDFIYFSHGALAIIAGFSSLIVSIIEKGNIRGGIKYLPMFLISSQLFYLFCMLVMTAVFGSLIKF